jgi:hypothetical protein
MKTPSKDMPLVTTAMFMAIIVGMHTVALLTFIKFWAGVPLSRENAKIIIIVGMVLLAIGSYYYYISNKNGERIIKKYAGVIGERTSVSNSF